MANNDPISDDLKSSLLLKHFKIASTDGDLYELGCSAKPQNIHSQQQRAFNLAWALNEEKKITHETRIAVIGGGISGLTVSSALLAMGASVSIYERSDQVLHFQKGSSRFLHPNISKWPNDAAAGYPATHLPFMNWVAGSAEIVSGELNTQWEMIEKVFSSKVSLFLKCQVRKITILDNEESKPVIKISTNNGKNDIDFDLCILAVGYGIERIPKNHFGTSYWRNDDINQPILGRTAPAKVLVTGGGDGGLIEVLRLKIRDFQHSSFFNVMYDDWVKKGIKKVDSSGWNHLQTMPEDELKTKFPAFFEKTRLRDDVEVYLNGFDEKAQPLHLFMVSLLIASGKVTLIAGRYNSETGVVEDTDTPVKIEGHSLPVFDRVIIRHGTESAIEKIEIVDIKHTQSPLLMVEDSSEPASHEMHYPEHFLADEFMTCHGEYSYEVGFSLWEQGNERLITKRILKQFGQECSDSDFNRLDTVPIIRTNGNKAFSIQIETFELITFRGSDPQTTAGVKTSWRSYHPKEFRGLIFRTNSRRILESLFSEDCLKYNLLRIYISDSFPDGHLDWLINFDTQLFATNMRSQNNSIEFHCEPGMFRAHTYLRFPFVIEAMKNIWPLVRIHGIGWAVRNSLQTNRKLQRGNELLQRN